MESRFRVLFLIVAMISLSGCAATKNLFGFDSREETSPTAEPLTAGRKRRRPRSHPGKSSIPKLNAVRSRNRRLTAKTSKLVRLQGS
jgi:hypothetical protein